MSAQRLILLSGLIGVLGASAAFISLNRPEAERLYVEVGSVIVTTEVASSQAELSRGLSGRKSLGEDEGMLFMFDEPGRHSIWMKDMMFPIDIVWINDGRVVSIKENAALPPPNMPDSLLPVYAPDLPAEFVLEVGAGFVRKNNIEVGHGVGIYRGDGTVLVSRAPDLQSLPGYTYFIETLRRTPLAGKNFSVGETLLATDAYTQYFITYESDGLLLSGVMNLPNGPAPEGGFPVLILNHGLMYPEVYYSGRGSRREKDFFSRNGYVAIHPDYRGYGIDSMHECRPTLSWTPRGCEHDFYVGYTRDVLNLIAALKDAKDTRLNLVDVGRIGMWGHSMGGGIAARVAVLMPEIKAHVLFASISADAEDNFYELPEYEISRVSQKYGIGVKASEAYEMISPLSYFENITAPFQIHHGTADSDVPIEFSDKMYAELKRLGKPVEFFIYPGEEHEFIEDWQLAANRSLAFFDHHVKNAE